MNAFSPHVEILPPAQRRLWPELADLPSEFVLYGGTAIALHLGHRQSIDFDFFARRDLDLDRIASEVPFLADASVIQREKNTLSVIVERDGPVKVSFFGVPRLPQLAPALIVEDIGLKVASLLDLAGTKASVVQVRAESKDYIDIDALLQSGRIDLSTALAAAQAIYGKPFNPQITLKALSHFDEGDLRRMPVAMKDRLAAAARSVDLDHLPAVHAMALSTDVQNGVRP